MLLSRSDKTISQNHLTGNNKKRFPTSHPRKLRGTFWGEVGNQFRADRAKANRCLCGYRANTGVHIYIYGPPIRPGPA